MNDEERVVRALRRELSQIDADLAAIPSDQFAKRSPMLKRRDEVAADLRAAVVADPETLARWADRASSKETGDGSKPFIPSHTDGGGI